MKRLLDEKKAFEELLAKVRRFWGLMECLLYIEVYSIHSTHSVQHYTMCQETLCMFFTARCVLSSERIVYFLHTSFSKPSKIRENARPELDQSCDRPYLI